MKIYLDSIGCRLNQSEIEKYALQFRAAGHTLVADPAEADIVVVNTCAVTAEGASDSRGKIRQAARAGNAKIVATGCWATLEPDQAMALPHVVRVVSNLDKDALVADLLGTDAEFVFDLEPLARQPLPGAHQRTRAFIKVQDGCDNHCTFCVTRMARGPGRSRQTVDVLADIHAAVAGGAQEVVLTGVHLGSWGADFSPPAHLRQLIATILSETDVPRLSLSSLEPWDLEEDFFSLFADPRLCRHLHLPLQSGCEATLRRMVRKTTPAEFARIVGYARAAAPDLTLTTDLIVGFPGETAAEFAESLEFVKQMNFAAGHVFSFSPRPGTPAQKLSGTVPTAIKKTRSAAMRATLAESGLRFRAAFVGLVLPVLWEADQQQGPSGWLLDGMTANHLRVTALSPAPRWNQIDSVRLDEATPQGFSGTLLPAKR